MAHKAVTIPDADVLVHAGDFCGQGTLAEVEAFAAFFRALPHRHKILIAGNHDWPLEREPAQAEALLDGCGYLRDGAVTITVFSTSVDEVLDSASPVVTAATAVPDTSVVGN